MHFQLIFSKLGIQTRFYFFDFVDATFAIVINAVIEFAVKLPSNFKPVKAKH
jgi:hypothetical protein